MKLIPEKHRVTVMTVLAAVGTVIVVVGMVEGVSQSMRDDHTVPVPTVTVTRTVTATPTIRQLPNARSSHEDGKAALTRVSVETAWRKESAKERASMCEAWQTDPYLALEAFMEAVGGTDLDSAVVKAFFDEKCKG